MLAGLLRSECCWEFALPTPNGYHSIFFEAEDGEYDW